MIVAPEVPGDEAGCSPAGGGPNGTRRPSGDSGGSSGHDEQTVVAQVLRRLGSQYALPESDLDMAVRAALAEFDGAKVRLFLPVFVERRVRTRLALAGVPRTRWTTARMAPLRGEGGWISAGHTAGTAIGG